MADDKKTKIDTAPKSDTAPKIKDTAAKEVSTPKGGATTGSETTSAETTSAAPASYSRGEGQKPVTAAYKENWNLIFGKKNKKKTRSRKG